MKNAGKINRRSFLRKIGIAGSLPLVAGAAPSFWKSDNKQVTGDLQKQHRNVLLLISDDHGIDQLGCYGNSKINTPNLDKMAGEGVRFTNAFAVAASCSASRGSIFSGLYPHQNGQFGHQHNWHHFSYHNWVQSLPLLLKKNGYKTGCVGKLHVAPDDQLPFDYRVFSKDVKGNRDVLVMAEKAGEFFNQDKDEPFFLLMGYSDPHRSASGMSSMKNVENFSGFGNDVEYSNITPKLYDPANVTVPEFLPDTPEVRLELADQYQSIDRLDKGIGKVIENLRKSGRYNDTLIIYISDNGIPFPGAKTNIYDSGVHLPMIINSPQIIKEGKVNQAMISFVDLLPTILAWTESSGPEYELPGRSFLPILSENNPSGWDEVYHSHTFHEITMYYPMRAIRTKKYRYIQNIYPELEYPFATDLFISKTWQGILKRKPEKMGKRNLKTFLKRPAEELYDLAKDPVEANNLIDDANYKEVLSDLRNRLNAMRNETDDPWLITDNYIANRTLY